MSRCIIFNIVSGLLLGFSFVGNSYASVRTLSNPKHLSFYETLYFAVNTTKPPFDNISVRYALAMATDRESLTVKMSEKRFKYFPSVGLIPQFDGYEVLKQLNVMIAGESIDVVSYNPGAARDILAKAGFPKGIDKNNKTLVVECSSTRMTIPTSLPL